MSPPKGEPSAAAEVGSHSHHPSVTITRSDVSTIVVSVARCRSWQALFKNVGLAALGGALLAAIAVFFGNAASHLTFRASATQWSLLAATIFFLVWIWAGGAAVRRHFTR